MHRALLSVNLEVRYQKVERIPQPFGGQGTGDRGQGTGDRGQANFDPSTESVDARGGEIDGSRK